MKGRRLKLKAFHPTTQHGHQIQEIAVFEMKLSSAIVPYFELKFIILYVACE